jgi:predicted  nucleic acid-binding Zn-ribbon protein
MTGGMRNLEELMKTQVIHTNDDTVNQALKMSEELQALRKENETLKAERITFESEREGYVSQIKSMEKELIGRRQQEQNQQTPNISNGSPSDTEKKLMDDLRSMRKGFEALYEEFAELKVERDELQSKLEKREEGLASAKPATGSSARPPIYPSNNDGHSSTPEELRLAEQVRCLQVSCDSLFNDLDKVKKERDELKAAAGSNGASKRPPAPTQSRSSMLSWMASTITAAPNDTADIVGSNQASSLVKAVEKHGSTAPNSSSNSMERKLQELEVENLKLKSSIVQLQTQFKEERYKNQQLKKERLGNSSPSPRQPKRSISLQVPNQYPDANNLIVRDGIDEDNLPSPLASEGSRTISKLESLKPLSSPTRSASLRRIHEYRAKKEPSKETISVSTASTRDTIGTDNSGTLDARESLPTGSLPTTTVGPMRTLGSITQLPPNARTRTTSSSSSESAVSEAIASSHKIPLKRNNSNGLTWGRSPARDMQQQDTQRVLTSHPAYRKVNRNHSGESVSSLSSNGGTDGPKRTQSLMGMIWGS